MPHALSIMSTFWSMALQCFLSHLESWHVLVRSGNTQVVSNWKHQGVQKLLKKTRKLLVWAYTHLTSIRAAHVLGGLNSAADMLLRDGPWEGDWRLHRQVMQQLWAKFRMAQVGSSVVADSPLLAGRPWFRMLLSLKSSTPWQLFLRSNLLSQARGHPLSPAPW